MAHDASGQVGLTVSVVCWGCEWDVWTFVRVDIVANDRLSFNPMIPNTHAVQDWVNVTPVPLCSFVDNVFKPSDEVLEKAKEWHASGSVY